MLYNIKNPTNFQRDSHMKFVYYFFNLYVVCDYIQFVKIGFNHRRH